MFEYLKTKQMAPPKRSISHSVVQQRAIPDRNGYADRFAKPEYYPIRETGSVVQRVEWCANCGATLRACRCGKYEPADEDNDPDYCEHNCHQYLNPTKLRQNLGAQGKSGEAHHIIPGNIVQEIKWVNGGNKDQFNGAWNGIMLNGSERGNEIIHKYQDPAPKILHRKNNIGNHRNYDTEVINYIKRIFINLNNLEDCKACAFAIRLKIRLSQAYSLDDLSL